MNELLLDECLCYLKEADNYLSLYHEIDPFEEIFEAYRPDTQLQVEQNKKAKTGVMGSLTKAIRALKQMIINIINSIRDFIEKRTMGKEERQAYEAYKEAVAKDPTLKNKKITVRDFRALNKNYESILKEAELADRELEKGNNINVDAIIDKITKFCGDCSKGVLTAVTAEAAINIASSSTDIAKKISESLEKDKTFYKKMEENIGKRQTNKFKKDMESLSKRISFRRFIMKMKGTYSKSVEDGVNKTFDSVFDLVGHAKNLASSFKNYDSETQIKGTTSEKLKSNVSFVKNNGADIIKSGKSLAGNNIAKRILGNKTIRDTGIDVLKYNSKKTKDAKALYKQKEKERKQAIKAAKNKKPYDQSIMDSLIAKNDPDAVTHKLFERIRK